ncbi:MAG: hypothetical protein E7Z89_08730 [Cyanobacteria bacterium SIG28]|nr:hypothetical protein [Cyanobacteria bacterium SIG28]
MIIQNTYDVNEIAMQITQEVRQNAVKAEYSELIESFRKIYEEEHHALKFQTSRCQDRLIRNLENNIDQFVEDKKENKPIPLVLRKRLMYQQAC